MKPAPTKAISPYDCTSGRYSKHPIYSVFVSSGILDRECSLVILIFFVLAYSVKGLRFKEVLLLDSVTSSIHFVGPMIYALLLTGFSSEYLPLITAFFLWGAASHAFGAVQDIIPDREGGLAYRN